MTRRDGHLWILLSLAVSSGCSFHAFSPPARVLILENAEVSPVGKTTVSLEGGLGGFGLGDTASYTTVRVRRGFTDELEGSLDLSVGYIDGGVFDCEPDDSTCRPGGAHGAGAGLRLGAKWAPWRRYFALTMGVGGGGSTFGGMFGVDGGAIASYDNRYVIPFITTNVALSVPIDAQSLHYGTVVDSAVTTVPWTTSLGLKVPIGPIDAATRGAILGGVGFVYVDDGSEKAGGPLASLGGEVTF